MPIKASNRLGMVSLSMYEMQMDMAPVVVSTRATNVLGAVMVSRLHLDMQDTVQKYSIAKALRNGSRDGALHGRQRIRSANIAPLLLHRLKVRLPAMPGPRCRGVAVEPARCLSRPLRASITDACAIGAARRIPVFDATNPLPTGLAQAYQYHSCNIFTTKPAFVDVQNVVAEFFRILFTA
jgi:hypothetical protein